MQNKHETNFENTKEQLNETLTENGASSKKKGKNYGDSQKKTAKYVISAIAVGNESVTEVPAAPIERKIQLGQGVFTPCNVIENKVNDVEEEYVSLIAYIDFMTQIKTDLC